MIELIHNAETVGEHFTEPATGDAWATFSCVGRDLHEYCDLCQRQLAFGLVRYRNREIIGHYCMGHTHRTYLHKAA